MFGIVFEGVVGEYWVGSWATGLGRWMDLWFGEGGKIAKLDCLREGNANRGYMAIFTSHPKVRAYLAYHPTPRSINPNPIDSTTIVSPSDLAPWRLIKALLSARTTATSKYYIKATLQKLSSQPLARLIEAEPLHRRPCGG